MSPQPRSRFPAYPPDLDERLQLYLEAVRKELENVGTLGGATLLVKESDALLTPAHTMDFAGADFVLSETPSDEVNISLEPNIARLNAGQTWTAVQTFDLDPGAPFAVTAGSAKVANLNADLLDGFDETAFGRLAVARTWTAVQTLNGGTDFAPAIVFGRTGGTGGIGAASGQVRFFDPAGTMKGILDAAVWTFTPPVIVGTDPTGAETVRIGGTTRWKLGGIGPGALAQLKTTALNADNPGLHFRRFTGGGSDYYHSSIENDASEGLLFRTAPPAVLGAEVWVSRMVLSPVALTPAAIGGLALGTAALPWGTVNISGDLKIGSLGVFDSADTPTEGQLLIYKAGAINKWQAESLNAIWGDTDFKAAILADGAASYIFFDPETGADSPVGAPATPGALTVTQQHGTHTVELRDYAKPADFRWFEFEYSKDGVAWFLLANATSPKVVHSRLPFDGTTFRYRVRIEDRFGNHSADSAVAGPFTPIRTGETHAFGAVIAGEIAVANLAAITATMGILTSGQIRGPGNTAGINFSGAGGIPGTWVLGINFENTTVTGMTRYLNFNSTAHNNLFKTERLTIGHDGTVLFYQTGTQPLFKLDATDFLLQNDAPIPTQGVLIDGTLPTAWTRYLDLTGDVGDIMLKHDKLELKYDGSAIFKGQVDITSPQITGQPLGNSHVLMRVPGIAHGMTTIVDTNVIGALRQQSGSGGFQVQGFTDAGGSGSAVALWPTVGAANTVKSTVGQGAFEINAWKKSGTGRVILGANENIAAFKTGDTTRFILDADGDSHQDVGTAWTNFDEQDDVALLTQLSVQVAQHGDPIRQSLAAWLDENRERLEAMKLVTFNEDGHHFVNMSKLTMLLTGAVRQLSRRVERVERLEQARLRIAN